jgi:acetyltransferase-like isoleucine patch superfamily enzyme
LSISSLRQTLRSRLSNSIFLRSVYAKFLSQGNSIRIIGKQNTLQISSAILKKCSITIEGNGNSINLGIGAYLEGVKIVVKAQNSKLTLGKSVFVGHGSVLWIQGESSKLEIGEYSSLEKVGIASSDGQEVLIGRDCLLSYDVDIRNTDSHSIYDNHTDTDEQINFAKSVKIGDHVWLGARSMILKGVVIGEGSIVGAGSVVTQSVESRAIAAGNPAKVIRKNIYWKH